MIPAEKEKERQDMSCVRQALKLVPMLGIARIDHKKHTNKETCKMKKIEHQMMLLNRASYLNIVTGFILLACR